MHYDDRIVKLFNCLRQAKPAPESLPEFIREVEDKPGVRVLRLRGSVGKEIGGEVQAAEKEAEKEGAFSRSLLFDFKETTGWDFATIAYLVEALRQRMAARAQVGIINASPQLVAELQIARLEGMLRVYASEEEALKALGPRS